MISTRSAAVQAGQSAPASRLHLAVQSQSLALRLAGLILFLMLWELAPRLGWVEPTYLSPPSEVFQTLIEMGASGELAEHFLWSLQRVLIGLLLSTIIGVTLGLVIGFFPVAEAALDLLFQFFRQMSAFALFPVFILLFGLGELSKDLIIFWASLWPVLLNTIGGVRNTDKLLIQSVQTMGASKSFIFRKVILSAAAPDIFTGIRLGASYCVMAVVAAEMIGATAGLGYLVMYSQETFHIPAMYGAIVMLAFLGIGINRLLSTAQNHFIRWKKQ